MVSRAGSYIRDMTTKEDTWSGTVVKKSRALLDGSSLYRRLAVRLDDGRTMDVKVDRDLWKELRVGDRLEKLQGASPRRCAERRAGSD